jgi:hypothetical protein
MRYKPPRPGHAREHATQCERTTHALGERIDNLVERVHVGRADLGGYIVVPVVLCAFR